MLFCKMCAWQLKRNGFEDSGGQQRPSPDLVFSGNTFSNKPADHRRRPPCTRSTIEGNLDAKTTKKPVDFDHERW